MHIFINIGQAQMGDGGREANLGGWVNKSGAHLAPPWSRHCPLHFSPSPIPSPSLPIARPALHGCAYLTKLDTTPFRMGVGGLSPEIF